MNSNTGLWSLGLHRLPGPQDMVGTRPAQCTTLIRAQEDSISHASRQHTLQHLAARRCKRPELRLWMPAASWLLAASQLCKRQHTSAGCQAPNLEGVALMRQVRRTGGLPDKPQPFEVLKGLESIESPLQHIKALLATS